VLIPVLTARVIPQAALIVAGGVAPNISSARAALWLA